MKRFVIKAVGKAYRDSVLYLSGMSNPHRPNWTNPVMISQAMVMDKMEVDRQLERLSTVIKVNGQSWNIFAEEV